MALSEQRQLCAEHAKADQKQGATRSFKNDAQTVADERRRGRGRSSHEASQTDQRHRSASTSAWDAYATA